MKLIRENINEFERGDNSLKNLGIGWDNIKEKLAREFENSLDEMFPYSCILIEEVSESIYIAIETIIVDDEQISRKHLDYSGRGFTQIIRLIIHRTFEIDVETEYLDYDTYHTDINKYTIKKENNETFEDAFIKIKQKAEEEQEIEISDYGYFLEN
jgi:hypothetical protein